MSNNKQLVIVQPKTFITNDHIARELRNQYYTEQEINDRLEIDAVIQIQYYGLDVNIKDLDNDKEFKESIKHYLSILRAEHNTYKNQRKILSNTQRIKRYGGLPGQTVSECIKHAVHQARLEIVDCIKNNQPWQQWDFIFQFNSAYFPFNPWSYKVYEMLVGEVNKVVKANRI